MEGGNPAPHWQLLWCLIMGPHHAANKDLISPYAKRAPLTCTLQMRLVSTECFGHRSGTVWARQEGPGKALSVCPHARCGRHHTPSPASARTAPAPHPCACIWTSLGPSCLTAPLLCTGLACFPSLGADSPGITIAGHIPGSWSTRKACFCLQLRSCRVLSVSGFREAQPCSALCQSLTVQV